MSMEPRSWPEPAPEVARAVRAKYSGRQVPLPVVVRDRLGELFADAEFAEAFATGPRGWSPGRLGLVTVLQMAENLTGRQAAEAVRDLNRLELAGEAVRAALEALTCADPDWVAQSVDVASWSRRYGPRVDSRRLPTSRTKQQKLAVDFARDGFALLGAVHHSSSPGWLRELPAVQVLRCVLPQNYTRTTTRGGREVLKRRKKTDEGGDGRPATYVCPYPEPRVAADRRRVSGSRRGKHSSSSARPGACRFRRRCAPPLEVSPRPGALPVRAGLQERAAWKKGPAPLSVSFGTTLPPVLQHPVQPPFEATLRVLEKRDRPVPVTWSGRGCGG
ncbi:hypothetical protein ACH4U7_23520 [Streptomyces sp. NPDC020845]|uniref:hypothetical protein n=1 Tax=Streptomyces sp. NPDC020845 TaxID=3365096 RepID=UPI00379D78C3